MALGTSNAGLSMALNLFDSTYCLEYLQNRQAQRLSKHIPESKYVSCKYDAEIIHLSDLQYNCTLLRAQIDSIKREPSLLESPGMISTSLNPFGN